MGRVLETANWSGWVHQTEEKGQGGEKHQKDSDSDSILAGTYHFLQGMGNNTVSHTHVWQQQQQLRILVELRERDMAMETEYSIDTRKNEHFCDQL